MAEEFTFRRPATLVFIGTGDAGNCCAANYERIVFTDKKVLKLTKTLKTLRLNRGLVDKEVLERYGVQKTKPAIVVTDCEGEVVQRFVTCVNARDVSKAMIMAVKISKRKQSLAKKVRGYLAKAQKHLAEGEIHQATLLFRKVLNVKGAPAAGDERAQRVLKELGAEGQRRFAEAQQVTSNSRRFDQLIELRREFVLYEDLIKPVRAEIVKLEQGESTKDEIYVHKGMCEIERALKIKEGKRSRSILREVRYKWKGTEAGERAEKLLEK